MKVARLAGFAALFLLAVAVAAQVAPTYQTGTVVAVNKLPAKSSPGGPDSQLAMDMDRYDVQVQVAQTVYIVRVETFGGSNLDHLKSRKYQVRIKGKLLYAKTVLGDEVKLRILHTEKAPTP